MTASTRDRVLDAALVSFAARGYEATSLDDVAGEVGVSKQAVLYYHSSKAALLDAVVDRSAAELSAAPEEHSPARARVGPASKPWFGRSSVWHCAGLSCWACCGRSAASGLRPPRG